MLWVLWRQLSSVSTIFFSWVETTFTAGCFILKRHSSLWMGTHAVCKWGSSWPGSAECLRRRCRDTGVCTAGWVCLAHPTNTPHTLHCCHWSHRLQPGDRKYWNIRKEEIFLVIKSSYKDRWLHIYATSDAFKEEQSSLIYLWFLAVVFVLYPIDLLQ